jgi:hypothetical protein
MTLTRVYISAGLEFLTLVDLIKLQAEVVRHTPLNSPALSPYLADLEVSFMHRFEQLGEVNINEALGTRNRAASIPEQ